MKRTDEIKSSTYRRFGENGNIHKTCPIETNQQILSVYDTLLRDGPKGRGRQGASPSTEIIPHTYNVHISQHYFFNEIFNLIIYLIIMSNRIS